MRWQTTAVVAVVLLALGAFYYVYEIKGGPARAKVEAQKGRLWTVDAGDVTEVELKRTGEVVRLKREADGWQILEPVTARGDRAKVDETLTTLTTARVDREIESAPKRLDQYGLDTPAADITLRLKDGRQLGLQLGAKNPTGVWAYAREAGKPAVFVVSDMVLRDVTRPLADFRDRTVLAFGQRQVTAFEVATREETLAVEQADGRWKLTRPVALPPTPRRSPTFSTSSSPCESRSSSPRRRSRWSPTASSARSVSRSTRAATRTARPRRSSSERRTGRSGGSTPCGPASRRCCSCPPRRGRSCRRTSRRSGTRSSWRSTGTR